MESKFAQSLNIDLQVYFICTRQPYKAFMALRYMRHQNEAPVVLFWGTLFRHSFKALEARVEST